MLDTNMGKNRRRKILAGVCAAALMLSGAAAMAEETGKAFEFDLRDQSLAQALKNFGLITDQQVMFSADLVSGKKVSALSGTLEADKALGLLLENSGLIYEKTAEDVILIKSPKKGAQSGTGPVRFQAAQADASGTDVAAGPVSASQKTLDEVIVTATKTGRTDLQKTGISITAFSGDTLDNANASDVTELAQFIPNVRFDYFGSSMTAFIRGVGSDNTRILGDQNVGFYVDGVYIEKGIGPTTDFLDVERVEVLKGPQGTLYGRNTTAGAVNIITKAPTDEFEVAAAGEVGSFNKARLDLGVSGPIVEGILRGRLAYTESKRDGYVKNLIGPDLADERFTAMRGSLVFFPSDSVEIKLSTDYRYSEDNGPAFKLVNESGIVANIGNLSEPRAGVTSAVTGTDLIPSDFWEVENDHLTKAKDEVFGIAATVTVDLPADLSLTSISAYREIDQFNTVDYDGTELDIIWADAPTQIEQYSQELQLNGALGPVDWVVGAFYYAMSDHSGEPANYISQVFNLLDGLVGETYYNLDTEAWSTFGSLNWHVSDRLTLGTGVRYSHEEKSLDYTTFTYHPTIVIPPVPIVGRSGSWNALTPKFSVDFEATDDAFLYASVSRGFKAGTLGTGSPVITLPQSINPEFIWAYETGFKTSWYDDTLRVNGAVFYYDYSDLQVQTLVSGISTTTNAAGATVQGVELDVIARPIEPVTFNLSLGYLDATYGDYTAIDSSGAGVDASGNTLIGAPKWSALFGAEYEAQLPNLGGSLVFRADLSWKDKYFFSALEDPLLSQDDTTLLNALVRYRTENERWTLELFGKNLTEEETYSRIINFTRLGPPFGPPITAGDNSQIGNIGLPRTYGIQLTFKY